MTKLPVEKFKLLRVLWGEQVAIPEIAKRLNCFQHCQDGGISAVIGIAHRMRTKARKDKDSKEELFWTRRRRGARGRASRHGTSAGPRSSRKERIASLVEAVPEIEAITDEESLRLSILEICGAADTQIRNGDPV